jgi:uncharacterized RDD family membrane protein YckC
LQTLRKKLSKKPGAVNVTAPGFLRRLAAISYDFMLLLAVLFLATVIVLPINGGEAFTSHQTLYPLYLLSVSFVFYGWFWTHGGQTLGMRAWKIKLISDQAGAVTWAQAAIRFVVAIVSWACLGLGFFWCLFNHQGLTWHDSLSKTRLHWLASEQA